MSTEIHGERIQRAFRVVAGAGIYRWLVGVAFLLAAFTEYPQHKWSIGLGYLAFIVAFGALLQYAELVQAQSNKLMDHAERKTRHTVVAAAEFVRDGLEFDPYDFWTIVDSRVSSEMGADHPSGVWKNIGLTAWNVASRAFGDILGLGIAAALTSSSSY